MTNAEYNEAAALVVRLREECTQANDIAACLEQTNDDLTRALAATVDALVKSNAQCGEYLRHNEMLAADRATLYAELQTVIAERDKEYEAGALMQNKLAETTKDLAYSRLAVDTMCARDKRFTSTIAQCGAGTGEDIGDFIERTAAERAKLHSELVDARAALASVTEQRDSLKRTLDEWERADTKPHERIEPPLRMGLVSAGGPVYIHDDVADHVVPPVCFDCGSRLVEVGGLMFLCRSADCMKRLTTGAP